MTKLMRLKKITDELKSGKTLFITLDEMEKAHIVRAIEITKGNRSKACELLGISRAALWRKLKVINTEK